MSAAAAASLAIGRSRSTRSRSWAPTGRRRRRRCFVVEIGRFVAGVVVHLDRSRFQARKCHQLYALARNMDAESCRSAGLDAVGAGVGCCKRWEDTSTEYENVSAACQISRDEDCRVSMSGSGSRLESVDFETKVAQHLAPLLLERRILLRMISKEFTRECEAFPIDQVRW